MLTLESLRQLLTPNGQAALLAAERLTPTDATLLRDLAALRKAFAPELASAALETVLLRQRARAKFSRADQMYFTREALEQASGELVARHRAERYVQADGRIYDVCCSIGGDALELTEAGSVVGLDIDPLRLAIAEVNAAVYRRAERISFILADARSWAVPPNAWLFFDPARRSGGRRHWQPEDYEPPLSLIESWLPHAAGIGVKVAPGIDYDALPYDCEVEIVSVAGEVKEACLWFGALRRSTRSAVLLPGRHTLHAVPTAPVPVVAPLRYLYEPDGAVIRAHLVEQLAEQIDAAKIDESIAFLTSDSLVHTPFARAFRVLETMPFNLKRLRARLRELDIGQVVIKKRGSPIDPQVLEKQLRLRGSHALTLMLTHVQGQPSVLLCEPAAPTPDRAP
ncbi:MAG TPA: class I SAM-dependent methyltransferase [Herpetosiphonaceae bacterium]